MDFCLPEDSPQGLVVGVDEAGRGPLAGDVVAAAVVLDPAAVPPGLNDSKKLTARRRDTLFDEITVAARAWCIASASVEEIDRLNILQASMLAMRRAVDGLNQIPALVYVDGNRLPSWGYTSRAVVKGDSKIAAIAAASILAKVSRDRDMLRLDSQYPDYGFAIHKGYPTRAHLQALQQLGVSPVHRRSYGPVARLLESTWQDDG